mmetsp:Transcript_114452/g.220391  ORF Transcript_114452/g.220391 Transcript_114452/m.220391 type:complete len:396 (+) Transcript_114452:50-1237(+)
MILRPALLLLLADEIRRVLGTRHSIATCLLGMRDEDTSFEPTPKQLPKCKDGTDAASQARKLIADGERFKVYFDQLLNSMADPSWLSNGELPVNSSEIEAHTSTLKGQPRIESKVKGKYSKAGGCQDVTDVVRGSLEFHHAKTILSAVDRLKKNQLPKPPSGLHRVEVERIKNRFADHVTTQIGAETMSASQARQQQKRKCEETYHDNDLAKCEWCVSKLLAPDTSLGYRDVLVNLKLYFGPTDWHICELQLQYYPIARKKSERGHLLYKIIRHQEESVAGGRTWRSLKPMLRLAKYNESVVESRLPKESQGCKNGKDCYEGSCYRQCTVDGWGDAHELCDGVLGYDFPLSKAQVGAARTKSRRLYQMKAINYHIAQLERDEKKEEMDALRELGM